MGLTRGVLDVDGGDDLPSQVSVTPKRGSDGGIDMVALAQQGQVGDLVQCKSSISGAIVMSLTTK